MFQKRNASTIWFVARFLFFSCFNPPVAPAEDEFLDEPSDVVRPTGAEPSSQRVEAAEKMTIKNSYKLWVIWIV